MSSYIGAVQVGDGEQALIGSTLYGICSTSAAGTDKIVTLNSFDTLINGVTIQVRFAYGNTVLNNLTLKVGSTSAEPITGNCVCANNDIIAFTYENDGSNQYWRANHSIKIDTNNNIVTSIAGQEVNVATKTYVDNATAGLQGLTGAMHFKGELSALPDDSTSFANYDAGDVLLIGDKEYVYSKGINAGSSNWIELGDESSYVLKTSQSSSTVGSASGWDAGSTPTLGDPISVDNITNWDAGSASQATVVSGVLRLTNSTTPTLSHTATNIPNVTSVGTVPSLTVTSTTVVIPVST